jgi:hypothetical protein
MRVLSVFLAVWRRGAGHITDVLAKFIETCTDPRLEVCHLVHEDRARGGTDFYVLAILTGGKIGCSPLLPPTIFTARNSYLTGRLEQLQNMLPTPI